MGRSRKLETLEDYKRALRSKYGINEGVDYKPWLRVQDVKSRGIRSEIYGIKIPRVHHLLSSIESEFFYLAEFSDTVIDIREQFPLLPLNISSKIAKTIGVEHPKHPNTGVPIVMTTDFLLTLKTTNGIRYQAVSVKPESEFHNQRVLEKMDIERIWWELLGVDFKVFTGNELTRMQSKNISWATSPSRGQPALFSDDQISHALSILSVGRNHIYNICDILVHENIVPHSDALTLLRYLIAGKNVDVDLSVNIESDGFVYIKSLAFMPIGDAHGCG